jgi:N-acetylneuraminic acid mutarotase
MQDVADSKRGRHGLLVVAYILALLVPSSPAIGGNWKTKASMPIPEFEPQVGAINGVLYVAGGNGSRSLQAFNPSTNKWSSLAPIPNTASLTDAETAVFNSQLYIIGGASLVQATFAVMVYDPPSNTWTTRSGIPHLNAGGVAGVIDGKIYVTTGTDGFAYRNLLDVYDPATDAWTSLAGSSVPHQRPAGGVINGKLYVAGGADANGNPESLVEVYDPATNAWTTLASMPSAILSPAGAVIAGKLYAFGGYNGTMSVTTVQVYDPIKNSWTITTPSVPVVANGSRSDVLDGIAFVVGGQNDSGTFLGTNDLYFQAPSIP